MPLGLVPGLAILWVPFWVLGHVRLGLEYLEPLRRTRGTQRFGLFAKVVENLVQDCRLARRDEGDDSHLAPALFALERIYFEHLANQVGPSPTAFLNVRWRNLGGRLALGIWGIWALVPGAPASPTDSRVVAVVPGEMDALGWDLQSEQSEKGQDVVGRHHGSLSIELLGASNRDLACLVVVADTFHRDRWPGHVANEASESPAIALENAH